VPKRRVYDKRPRIEPVHCLYDPNSSSRAKTIGAFWSEGRDARSNTLQFAPADRLSMPYRKSNLGISIISRSRLKDRGGKCIMLWYW